MKKALALLLALTLCLSLAACGESTDKPGKDTPVTTVGSSKSAFPYAEDLFTLEQMGYDQASEYTCNIDFKFRNNTAWDMDRITFKVQFLDENGDKLGDSVMGEDHVDAGQAAWFTFQTNDSRSSKSIAELAEKICTLKIISVQVEAQNMPEAYRMIRQLPQGEFAFEAPLVFAVADIPSKEDGAVRTDKTQAVSQILISHTWKRYDENGEVYAVHTFSSDGTGLLSLSDGDEYAINWSVSADGRIDVIMIVDGRDAPGSYDLLTEDAQYIIQMVDNHKFTYYAE